MIFQPITSLLQKPTVDFPTNNLATASKPNLTATKLQHNTQTTVSKKLLIYIYKTKPNETKAWLGAFYATQTQNRAKNKKNMKQSGPILQLPDPYGAQLFITLQQLKLTELYIRSGNELELFYTIPGAQKQNQIIETLSIPDRHSIAPKWTSSLTVIRYITQFA